MVVYVDSGVWSGGLFRNGRNYCRNNNGCSDIGMALLFMVSSYTMFVDLQ